MKIKKLHLSNFRRFTDFTIGFDPQLTVLVARNGAGKSSVLDAVATAIGPFLTRLPGVSGINPKESDFRVLPDGSKPPYMRIACESFEGICWDRTEKRDQSKKTAAQIPPGKGQKELNEYVDSLIDAFNESRPFELPVFIYYGTGRAVFDVPQRKKGFGKDFTRFDALQGALESRTNFRRFVEYFYYLEDKEILLQKKHRSFDLPIPELIAIRVAIGRLMPDFSNPRGIRPAGIMLDWRVGHKTKQLRIEQLSDGYRTTLAMVMDIAARMAEANPPSDDLLELLASNYDPLDKSGVVLIDEIDLHLHPGWQQRILPDLMKAFPKIQFIVTTHSPQVVTSVPATSLRVIDWVDEEPQLLPVDFSLGAEAQQMLIEVLGVSPRPDQLDIVKKLKRYQELVHDNQWDTENAVKIRAELDQWGAEHEPELLRLDMDIRLKELDR
ncbi:AAA family ATPase [Methylicorpusculum sp.]|uniref:AAA family ATPase n=1 Tax=Methylicorpusculum sp. TaxID=2713644 RepID=UPI0027170648|nr:AAA family ATPase [Methylicorpusculum sp.]MDO8844771.1 AAA family ATPase [Methylicorpusculum sp.]